MLKMKGTQTQLISSINDCFLFVKIYLISAESIFYFGLYAHFVYQIRRLVKLNKVNS